jgi:hypothetical protein
MMLDSLGIGFSGLAGNAQCQKYVHDKPVARSHSYG